MGWRFRRSVKILPGVRLNFSGSGVSASLGRPGSTVNIGDRGTCGTVGLPGTGISYSRFLNRPEGAMAQTGSKSAGAALGWIAAAIIGLVAIGQCSSKQSPSGPAPAVAATTTATPRYVSARSLNCRSSPDATAKPLRTLARNTFVSITQEESGWSKVDGAPPCWVSTAFLQTSPWTSGEATSTGRSGTVAAGVGAATYFASQPSRAQASKSTKSKRKKTRSSAAGKSRGYGSGTCPCSGRNVCIGPRGGRYCITSGGNKRYGV